MNQPLETLLFKHPAPKIDETDGAPSLQLLLPMILLQHPTPPPLEDDSLLDIDSDSTPASSLLATEESDSHDSPAESSTENIKLAQSMLYVNVSK